MSLNLGIKLNKLLIAKRGTRMKGQLMTKAKKYEKRKFRQLEKDREKRRLEERDKLLQQRTMEVRHVKKLFPDAEFSNINVPKIPVEMKMRFEAWCLNRGYTPAGRLRKFIHECVIGRIKE